MPPMFPRRDYFLIMVRFDNKSEDGRAEKSRNTYAFTRNIAMRRENFCLHGEMERRKTRREPVPIWTACQAVVNCEHTGFPLSATLAAAPGVSTPWHPLRGRHLSSPPQALRDILVSTLVRAAFSPTIFLF